MDRDEAVKPGDEDKENAFRPTTMMMAHSIGGGDDVNNNCAKFLNRHKSLDAVVCEPTTAQSRQSLSSSKLLHSSSQDDADATAVANESSSSSSVRVSLALLRPSPRNSSIGAGLESSSSASFFRKISTGQTSASALLLSNKNSNGAGSGGEMDESQLLDETTSECLPTAAAAAAVPSNVPGSYQPILESSLVRVHKFLRDKKVYAADYNPKFKRRTIVLIKSKSSTFGKSTSTSSIAGNLSSSNLASSTPVGAGFVKHSDGRQGGGRQGSFGFNLQSYGVLNPSTMQVEYICFVSNVQPDSPAKKAGLENGDVVLSIDGIQIDEFKSLKEILEHVKNKSELKLVIITENVCKKIKYQQRIEQIKAALKDKYAELEALNAQEAEIVKKYNLDKSQLLRAKLSVFRSFSDGSTANVEAASAAVAASASTNSGGNMYSSYSESSVASDEKLPIDLSARKSLLSTGSVETRDDHEVLQARRQGPLLLKGSRSSSHRTSLNLTSGVGTAYLSPSPLLAGSKLQKSGNAKAFKLLPSSFSKLNNYKVASSTSAANTSKINHKSHSNLTIDTNAPNPAIVAASSSTGAFFASPGAELATPNSEAAPLSATTTASNNSKAKSFAKKFIFSNRIVRSASSSSMNLLSNFKFTSSVGGSGSKKSSNSGKKPLFSPLSSTVDDNPPSTVHLHLQHPASTTTAAVSFLGEHRASLDARMTSLDAEKSSPTKDAAAGDKIVLDSVINRLSLERPAAPEDDEARQTASWATNSISPAPSSSSRSSLASSSIQSAKKMFAPSPPTTDEPKHQQQSDLAPDAKAAPLASEDTPSSSLEHEKCGDDEAGLPVQEAAASNEEDDNDFGQLVTRVMVSSPSSATDKSFKSSLESPLLPQQHQQQLLDSSSSSSSKYKSLASNESSSSSLLYFSPISRDVSEVYINLNIDSANNNESNDDSCFLDPHASPSSTSQTQHNSGSGGEDAISRKLSLLTAAGQASFTFPSPPGSKVLDSLSSSSTSTISTFSSGSNAAAPATDGSKLAPASSSSSSDAESLILAPPPTSMRPPVLLASNREQDYIVTRL